jgi:Bacterial Ig domain/Putative Ig domain
VVSCGGPSTCTAVGLLASSAASETAQPLIESSTSISNGEAPAITSGAEVDFTAGSGGTFAVTSKGSPTAFLSESGSLPNGVSFIDNGDGTATLSGTPVTGSAGTYPIVITAGNGVSPDATQSFTLTVEGPRITRVVLPSNGTTLSGSTYLDASASNATSVEFLLFGGTYGFAAPVLCTATPTIYGWLCSWNTTTVPDGSYVLVSEAFNSVGSTFSTGVGITVNNPQCRLGVRPSSPIPRSQLPSR